MLNFSLFDNEKELRNYLNSVDFKKMEEIAIFNNSMGFSVFAKEK